MSAAQFRLKAPEPKEADVLRSVLHVLQRHPKVGCVWRANSGSGHLARREGGTSQFIRFGFKGQPDVIGYMADGRALFVEVKRPSGVVRPEQQAFLDEAAARGCVAFIARGVDDVINALGPMSDRMQLVSFTESV